jgi:hypothetical protein
MADAKISTLPASTNPLAGTEVLPIVQSGSTKQVSVANLTTGRSISVSGLTNTALTSGRITYATTGGQLTDNAGLTYGLSNVILSYTGATRIQVVNSTDGNNVLLTAGASNAVLNSANGYQWELQTASSTKLTVDNSSNVTVNLGNLVIGTSGKGIDFSASGQAAGMTSELLDDYEEGTWTPTIAFDGASVGVTYFAQTGKYTKVGDTVTVTGNLYIDSNGSSTGSLEIKGFPFSANSYSSISLSIRGGIAYTGTVLAYINVAEARASVEQTSEAGVMTPITQANLFTPQIFFTCTYTTSA